MPTFSSTQEELSHWKRKCNNLEEEVAYWKTKEIQIEQEFDEYQQSSQMLEKELEASLEQAEKANRELRTKCNRLQLEFSSLREKYDNEHQDLVLQITELQEESSKSQGREENYVKYIRELEQKNDDLERSQRAMYESLGEFESKLNSAIERNVLLESELDEKEHLKIMVQRLKDETRDLKQEIQVREREMKSDNEVSLSSRRCSSIRITATANVVGEASSLSNGKRPSLANDFVSPKPPPKSKHLPSGLATPNRISAMNIVGDLLRKIGALETKLAGCRLSTADQNRESIRRKKLTGGTSTPSIHNLVLS